MSPESIADGTDRWDARPRPLSAWEHLAALLSGRRFVWIDAAGGYRPTSVPKTAGRNLERGIEIARTVMSRLQQPFTRAIKARFREITVESRRQETVEGVLA